MKRMRRERERFDKTPTTEYCVQFQDEDLLNFTALISGPEDSLYRHKFIKLRFQIPSDYPLVPPKVTFVQYSGGRIHPNLYAEGKVCLSILGTWSGEPWASSMNIESVLVTIRSLLDNKPYLHEPGQKDNPAFNDYVRYSTWQCLLVDHLTREQEPKLREFMEQYIRDNSSRMMGDLQEQHRQHSASRTFTSSYSNQSVNVDYPSLERTLQSYISKSTPAKGLSVKDPAVTLSQPDHLEVAKPSDPAQPLTIQSPNKRKLASSNTGDEKHPLTLGEGQNKKSKKQVIELA